MTPGTEVEAILAQVREQCGLDFSCYKERTLARRVAKRMQTLGITDAGRYAAQLAGDPEEAHQLKRSVLIHVTSLFRDESAWTMLSQHALPELLAHAPRPLRVWCPGCATGDEPYSLSLVLADLLGSNDGAFKIYATDVADEALAGARDRSWSGAEVEQIPGALRERWVVRLGDRWMVHRDVRRHVIFGRHDLLGNAPIAHLHLISCRNTLMYFTAVAQLQVLARFRFALEPGGVLFLGKAETLPPGLEGFEALDLPARIFRRTGSGRRLSAA